MPMWRCPHCGTPQAETARCWVCRRSSTACASCQNFRRSVAAQLGYCANDRLRRPLRGDEIRGCWEPSTVQPETPSIPGARLVPPGADPDDERTPVRKLEFVEIRTSSPAARKRTAATTQREVAASTSGMTMTKSRGDAGLATEPDSSSDDKSAIPVVSPTEPAWSLWGDAEI